MSVSIELTCVSGPQRKSLAKYPHSPILHYACRSLFKGKKWQKECNSYGTMRCFCCFLVVKQRTTHIACIMKYGAVWKFSQGFHRCVGFINES